MSPDQLSATFSALADPTRRAILARLASGETSVTELAEPFSISLPAISKHLKVLERAGLIVRTPHEVHGRIQQIEVTVEGKSLLAKCRKRVQVLEEMLVEGLDAVEEKVVKKWLASVAVKQF